MPQVFPVAFLAGSVGSGEVVLLFLVVLVLFGPRRLPDMARKAGKLLSELKRSSQNFTDQVMQMDREPPANALPPAPPESPSPVEGLPADPPAQEQKPPSDEHERAG